MTPSRDELYRKFGPILMEATLQSLIEIINESRRAQGWPDIELQDVYDRVNNHITELEPYDWMSLET